MNELLLFIGLYSFGVSLYCYIQMCKVVKGADEIIASCMVSHAVAAKETVDILVDKNVPHDIVNIFKKRYLCLTSELHPEIAQELDSMPVKINIA